MQGPKRYQFRSPCRPKETLHSRAQADKGMRPVRSPRHRRGTASTRSSSYLHLSEKHSTGTLYTLVKTLHTRMPHVQVHSRHAIGNDGSNIPAQCHDGHEHEDLQGGSLKPLGFCSLGSAGARAWEMDRGELNVVETFCTVVM